MVLLGATALACVIVAAITVRAWRGDGRTDLRRCPRCWYDMAAVAGARCPECGHAAARETDLRQRRYSRRAVRLGAGCAAALGIATLFLALPGAWTAKTPRPLLRVALALVAPPAAPPAGGLGLPTPDPALRDSRLAWDRLVWQRQANEVFRAWADAVLETEGPVTDEELARLAPLADEAHALFMSTGGLAGAEAWVLDRGGAVRARRRAGAAGGADRLLRAEWVLAELQYQGGGYSWREDFARVPDALITRALAHPDARVRAFGLDRFGRRAHERAMDPASPLPAGRETVETMATTDPDADVRRRAAGLVSYMEAFAPAGR